MSKIEKKNNSQNPIRKNPYLWLDLVSFAGFKQSLYQSSAKFDGNSNVLLTKNFLYRDLHRIDTAAKFFLES